MTKTYIHIGYPKNLSTTLQVDYFSRHHDIYHLGTGINHNTGYLDGKLESYFENILFCGNELIYRELKEDIKKQIEKHYKIFEASNKKSFGLSLEHISFSFTPADTDIYLKFKRLQDIFGKEIKIIAIIRNQFQLIKSLYRESIRVGYPYLFKEYIDFLYYNQNYSYLLELQYDKVLDLLSDFFSQENIKFIPIENFRNNKGKLMKGSTNDLLVEKLNSILQVENYDIQLNHNNATLNNQELYQKLQLNIKYRHELGNSIYEPVQRHRLKEYYKEYLKVDKENLYGDVKQKRLTLEIAKELAQNDPRGIDYYADPIIIEKLRAMFIKSNEKLVKKYNIDLPDSYFKMEF